MSNKFIQSIKLGNKVRYLFKVEIADKDQSLYIRFFTQNSSVKYRMITYDVPSTESKIQFIEAKPTEFTIEKPQSLKISYHYSSGKVHLQRYHNNDNKRTYISEDLSAINLSKLDDELNHIATIVVNNLDFFSHHEDEKQNEIRCLNLPDSNESDLDWSNFVITIFASKKDFYNEKVLEKINCFCVFCDPEVEKNDPSNLIYYYFGIREKLPTAKIESDLNFYLGWDKNITNASINNKMLFAQSL